MDWTSGPEWYFLALVVAAILLASQRPWRALSRILRAIGRFFRLTGRQTSKSARGAGGNAALLPLQWALSDSQIDVALKKFSEKEEKALQRKRGFFVLVEVKGNIVPHESTITPGDIDSLYENSSALFEPEIDYFVDRNRYYEEVEGVQIIEMIGSSDSRILHYLNEVRKTSNSNVLRYVTFTCFVVSTFVLLCSTLLVGAFDGVLEMFPVVKLGWLAYPKIIVIFVAFIVSLFSIWLLQLFFNAKQPLLMKSMKSYIVAYVSRLTERFRVLNAELNSIFNKYNNEEEARMAAAKWFVVFECIAFRQLLIELFARNCLFQMRRNLALYIFYIVSVFVAVSMGLHVALYRSVGLDSVMSSGFDTWQSIVFFVFGILALSIWLCISLSSRFYSLELPLDEEVIPSSWNGFKARRYRTAVGELAGLYNREIVFQRNRFRGGAGGFQVDEGPAGAGS